MMRLVYVRPFEFSAFAKGNSTNVCLEIKEVEAHLSKEIHLLDLKIAENTSKIAETKARLVSWLVGVGLLQTI